MPGFHSHIREWLACGGIDDLDIEYQRDTILVFGNILTDILA